MTATGLSLGALALAAEPELRRTRIRPRDVAARARLAAGLYVMFQVGDRLARRIVPNGAREIGEIYALRDAAADSREIAARLALVIGPAEELFWRGFVQKQLAATTRDVARRRRGLGRLRRRPRRRPATSR